MFYYLDWFFEVFSFVLLLLSLPTLLWLALQLYKRLTADGNPPPIRWKRFLLSLALAGDVLMIIILTLLDRTSTDAVQPHLFATFRAAWNMWGRSPGQIRLLFLNIAVLIPFGALVALRFKSLRRIWSVGLVSLAFSSLIELLQKLAERGVCDVDDILCNTLGGILGAAIVCLIFHLIERHPRRAALDTLPIAASLLFFGICFAVYTLKPYGNLSIAPTYRYPMQNVTVSPAPEDAPELPDEMNVYRIAQLTDDEVAQTAAAILSHFGLSTANAIHEQRGAATVYHFADDGLSLLVSRNGGNWELELDEDTHHPLPPTESVEAIAAYLASLDVIMPDGGYITAPGYEDIWFVQFPSELPAPELSVSVNHDRMADKWSISVDLIPPVVVASEPILSPDEVIDTLRAGNFHCDTGLPDFSELTVNNMTMHYTLDSKDFLVPVWLCRVSFDGAPHFLFLPALQ